MWSGVPLTITLSIPCLLQDQISRLNKENGSLKNNLEATTAALNVSRNGTNVPKVVLNLQIDLTRELNLLSYFLFLFLKP